MYLTVRVLMRRRETYVGKDVSLPCMCSMDVRTIFVYLPAYLPTYLPKWCSIHTLFSDNEGIIAIGKKQLSAKGSQIICL